MHFKSSALAALLLSTSSVALQAEDISYGQLAGFATLGAGFDTGAVSIGPEWSESLGMSLVGRLGYMANDATAVGVILEGGENVVEGVVNIGTEISPDVSALLSFGMLRENLEPSGSSDREWVSQQMYGLAIDAGQIGLEMFYIDSESTDNFDGAITYGIEAVGRLPLGENAILAAALGYQRSDWDDAGLGIDEALTGSLDLGVRASDVLTLTAFADHDLSQTQYGLGAGWALGTMSLDVEYVYSDAADSSQMPDDQRVFLTLSMPLGGGGVATRGSALPYYITASSQNRDGSGILADVIRRPTYLPTGSVVQQSDDPEIDDELLITLYRDNDGDGYGDPNTSILSAGPTAGYVENDLDCDDTAVAVNPGATEVFDLIDNDCDGETDEGVLPPLSPG